MMSLNSMRINNFEKEVGMWLFESGYFGDQLLVLLWRLGQELLDDEGMLVRGGLGVFYV